MEKIETAYVDSDQIREQSNKLLKIATRLQTIGVMVATFSFAGSVFVAVSLAFSVSAGVFALSESISFSDLQSIQLTSIVASSLSGCALIALLYRDGMIRQGQVIADILIERSERTFISDEGDRADLQVKIAIRSFAHLKSLPLTSEYSRSNFYASLATLCLFASIFLLVISVR